MGLWDIQNWQSFPSRSLRTHCDSASSSTFHLKIFWNSVHQTVLLTTSLEMDWTRVFLLYLLNILFLFFLLQKHKSMTLITIFILDLSLSYGGFLEAASEFETATLLGVMSHHLFIMWDSDQMKLQWSSLIYCSSRRRFLIGLVFNVAVYLWTRYLNKLNG